ncbi:MAG: EAL domain-containing protein [Xanthomonadales bacterium]|nr:EAL domain-containing protein [Xanthomonadales bacterium]
MHSMIDLAHHLDLTAVAEGVEDQPTLDRLTAMGCDLAQGFSSAARNRRRSSLAGWQAARAERRRGRRRCAVHRPARNAHPG